LGQTTLHDPGGMAGVYRSEMQSARLHFARKETKNSAKRSKNLPPRK
jgi:hypothetical protein